MKRITLIAFLLALPLVCFGQEDQPESQDKIQSAEAKNIKIKTYDMLWYGYLYQTDDGKIAMGAHGVGFSCFMTNPQIV